MVTMTKASPEVMAKDLSDTSGQRIVSYWANTIRFKLCLPAYEKSTPEQEPSRQAGKSEFNPFQSLSSSDYRLRLRTAKEVT
jgi:hypothetical protein